MGDYGGASPERRSSTGLGRGVRLGRIAGTELAVHWSLLVIFALVAIGLGAGTFALWHPNWTPLQIWSVAILAAVLLFASIAVHELAHALVGRWVGVPVERITLFLFGGMAQIRRPPPNPRAELLMSLAGPITSFVIGLAATMIGIRMLPAVRAGDTMVVLLSEAGPTATILLWLGPINIFLALFNILPGFPLDGGRVLRSLLWMITGNLRKATRWAAAVGTGLGWLLIAAGILTAFGVWVPLVGGSPLSGIWMILLGWFLSSAARTSYATLVLREALEGVPVSAVMRRSAQTVTPEISLDVLVNDYFMGFDQHAFPVVRDGRLEGLVCLEDIRTKPRTEWPRLTVADVMTPIAELEVLRPQDSAYDALVSLSKLEVNQLPVVDVSGQLIGMVQRDDILKWIALNAEP